MKKRIVRGPQVVILKKPPPAPLASFLANPTLLPKKPPQRITEEEREEWVEGMNARLYKGEVR